MGACPCCNGSGQLADGEPDCPYCRAAPDRPDDEHRWRQASAALRDTVTAAYPHGIHPAAWEQVRRLFESADRDDTADAWRQAAELIAEGGQYTDAPH